MRDFIVCLLYCFFVTYHHFALCALRSEDAIDASKRGTDTAGGQIRGEKAGELQLSFCVSVLLSLSLCCYRNSSAVPLFLSLRTMCSVEEFGRSLCTLVSTATGASSLNNASLACAGRELEATVPDASCFSFSKCSVIPPGILYQCDVNFP